MTRRYLTASELRDMLERQHGVCNGDRNSRPIKSRGFTQWRGLSRPDIRSKGQ